MKYSPEQYAEALIEAGRSARTAGERAEMCARLVRVLEKNGDSVHAEKVLAAVRRRAVRASGGRIVTVEAGNENAQRDSVALVRSCFAENDLIDWCVNPDLIAGVRININGEHELDASFAGRLNAIFS